MLITRLLRKFYGKYKSAKLRSHIVNSNHSALEIDINTTADMRKYGFNLQESKILDLKHNDYRDYISTWEAYQPRIKGNSRYFPISDDKYLFSLVFGNYIRVPESYALINDGHLVILDSECSDLYNFIAKKGGGVIKDRGGADGFNVYVFKSDGENLFYRNELFSREKFSKLIKNFKNGLIQEKITQGKFESDIFSESINTVRVISIRKNTVGGGGMKYLQQFNESAQINPLQLIILIRAEAAQ